MSNIIKLPVDRTRATTTLNGGTSKVLSFPTPVAQARTWLSRLLRRRDQQKATGTPEGGEA